MIPLVWITLGGLLMSAIALVGSLTLVLPPSALERLTLPMVSLAAGTLLGGAFFHMIPAGAATVPLLWTGTWVVAGFAAFLGLEELLHWHHCRRAEADCRHPVTYLILVGDALHNILGGLGVASTFLVNPTVGMMAWLAAAAHEVPQELGDFGVLLHGGWPRRAALRWNFFLGLTFLVGALLAYALSLRFDIAPLVLFGAGNFIYIAASDLVPEMKAHRVVLRQALELFGSFAVGVAAMLLLALVFRR